MGLLLLFLFLALFFSFICSIAEAVLLSVPIPYLRMRIEAGDRRAEAMATLKSDIDKPLSAILSLNTTAHTIGAAGVGAQANIVFGEIYFGLVSAILTILILVLSEIIPKTLGANYSKQLTGITLSVIKIMIFITYPLVILSSFITRMFSTDKKEHTTSREEMSALANIGAEEGIFGEDENKIIQNLMTLRNIRIWEIMTPRVVVVSANENLSLSEFKERAEYQQFSRIPVYKNDPENITGYVFRVHVYEKLAEDYFNMKMSDIKRNILIFQSNTSLINAWNKMLEKREHIGLVIDEYGGLDGIVTMEDIIETLLGFEIVDEKDQVEDMQKLAIELWRKKQKQSKLSKIRGNKT